MTVFNEDLFNADIDEIYVHSCCAEKAAASQPEDAAQPEQLTASQRSLLRLMKESGVTKVECFGGVLLQRENENGSPILSFVIQGTTGTEHTKMCKEYETIYRIGSSLPLIVYDPLFHERFKASGTHYSVFNFVCNPNQKSLREYCQDEKHRIPLEGMMRKLVNLLISHSNECGEKYRCLNFLSLDTIFVNAQGKLLLLPLQAFRRQFPCEIAPEARDLPEQCDARSDLYAAAYVALEASCNGVLPEMPALGEGMIKNCLVGVPQCRPTLRYVANALGSKSSEPAYWEASTPKRDATAPKKAAVKPAGNSFSEWCKALWMRFTAFFTNLFRREAKSETSGTMTQHIKRPFSPITNVDEMDEEEV